MRIRLKDGQAIEFEIVDTHLTGPRLEQYEMAHYSAVHHVTTMPGGRVVGSMVFTPEKCRALGLKSDAVPAGRVVIERLQDDNEQAQSEGRGAAAGQVERAMTMSNAMQQQETVSAMLAKARQILLDHGLEGSELDRVLCRLNREAAVKGAVLDGAPVIDTTEANRAKDQRQRRQTLMANRDRAIAKMRAGTAHSPGLSSEQAEERFHRENPDWYPQYRATFE
jgi:hypothetical protein